jgi:hypothetical protein
MFNLNNKQKSQQQQKKQEEKGEGEENLWNYFFIETSYLDFIFIFFCWFFNLNST